jgi:hypothetical protein
VSYGPYETPTRVFQSDCGVEIQPYPIVTINPMMPSILSSTPLGTVVATISVVLSNGQAFTGLLFFDSPFFDDGGTFSLTGLASPFSLIVNPLGPGVGSDGSTVQRVTIRARQ